MLGLTVLIISILLYSLSHQSGSDEEGSCDAVMEYGHYNHSGKMVVVNSLLKVWHSLGHRVLLFSQTRKVPTKYSAL